MLIELQGLKEKMNRGIKEAKKLIEASAHQYALSKTLIELGQLDAEEVAEAEAGNELLKIQGRLANRTIRVFKEAIAELDELIDSLEETEEEGEEGATEEEEFELDDELIAEVLTLLSK